MRRTFLIALSLIPLAGFAQTFSDDFESYTSGAKLAQSSSKWATWTGAGGGTDDNPVSNAKAHSGSNSVYFSSTTSTGGPADIVLPFESQWNTGSFQISMWMFVETGKLGYFNLQEQSTLGKGWTMDVNFAANGTVSGTNTTDGQLFSASYPQNQWFQIAIKADLNTASWTIEVDGAKKASFQNSYRQVAAMDIFPTNGSSFYLDDVSYSHTSFTMPAVNAAVSNIGNVVGYLAGSVVSPTVEFRNLGTAAITSADLEFTYNGNTYKKNIGPISVASNQTYTVSFTDKIVILAGNSVLSARVTAANGSADDNAADDEKILELNPLVPAVGKLVIGEEATGTWCQWCPRGAVMLKNMEKKYGEFFQGIAVHNNDPMMVFNYDRGMANYISGYPSALTDRSPKTDPSAFESEFLRQILITPKGVLHPGASYDANTGVLKVSITTLFTQNVSGNYKIACVITEDGVTGTTSNYNQSNAYSGGGNGVMGGFESLPNPVPASKMVYDHVARDISPGYLGLPNAFGDRNAGDSVTHVFTFNIESGWDISKMHVVGMLISPSGAIDNGGTATITEAIDHGLVSGTEVASTGSVALEKQLQLSPNPASNQCRIDVKEGVQVSRIQVLDMTGRECYSAIGMNHVSLNLSDWMSGSYLVRVETNAGTITKTLLKQ